MAILVLTGVVLYREHVSAQYSARLFENLGEFEPIQGQFAGEKDDPYLDGLVFEEGFCREILYDGDAYLVAAYVFPDEAAARQYFVSAWDENPPVMFFSGSKSHSEPGRARYMAFYENRVMYIEGTASGARCAAFENWLTEAFTFTVKSSGELLMERLKADPSFEAEYADALEDEIRSENPLGNAVIDLFGGD